MRALMKIRGMPALERKRDETLMRMINFRKALALMPPHPVMAANWRDLFEELSDTHREIEALMRTLGPTEV